MSVIATYNEPGGTPNTIKSPTTVESLRIALEQLGLNSKGHKQELKQRLKKAKKKQKESAEKESVEKEDVPKEAENEK